MTDFRIQSSVLLPCPRPEIFEFFSLAENLDFLTPPWLRFSILTPPPIEMKLGTIIEYRIRLRGIPVRWASEITEWDPPRRFTDTQIRGPYRRWVHRHLFEETPGGAIVTDDVTYQPTGGALADRLFVAGELRKIFAYRKARLLELYS